MSSYAKARTDDYEDKQKKSKCDSFLSAIYNNRKGTCFGRTPKSWGLIIIFYLIYYTCLSGFFGGMISVFLYNFIPVSMPMRTGRNSILTFTPGVNVNPRSTNESALIVGSSKNGSEFYKKYVDLTDKYMAKSFIDPIYTDGVHCDVSGRDEPKNVSKFCIFNRTMLGPCSDPKAELIANRLCIFVKINKIYGWLPQIENQTLSNDILLECGGQNPGDMNNIGSPVYYPSLVTPTKTYGRIPNMFFPYIIQRNYTSPMVAVQFPNMLKNLAILVQCSLRNIKNSFKQVRFEIMLLEK